MPFSKYGFSAELLRGIKELGFKNPTPIQEQALPPAIEGRDLLACAMTGSGKSAAFGLPVIHRLGESKRVTRALVLTPTRELAAQIDEHLNALAVHTNISSAAIYGGVGMGAQEHALRRGTDIIVATPGRLLDHMSRSYSNFKNLQVLVLDEADRMLDMGFLPDIKRIISHLPAKRQNLMFSATMPNEIAKLSREILHDPFTISVERQSAPAAGITQAAYPVPHHLKPVLLVELMKRGLIRSVIVFTRTKARADRLAQFLDRHGVSAGRIHGDRTQSQRTQTLERFKSGKFAVLVATDIAARGIDVESLSHVINFDIPPSHEDYIHRVGRTGRNQSQGDAFAFFSPDEEGALRDIERRIGQRLPRITLPDFDYDAQKPQTPPSRFDRKSEGERDHRSASPKPYNRFRKPGPGGYAAAGDRPSRPASHGDRGDRGSDQRGARAGFRPRRDGSSATSNDRIGGGIRTEDRGGRFEKKDGGRGFRDHTNPDRQAGETRRESRGVEASGGARPPFRGGVLKGSDSRSSFGSANRPSSGGSFGKKPAFGDRSDRGGFKGGRSDGSSSDRAGHGGFVKAKRKGFGNR
jgi:ATP-dependent RNA helicase RhlE